MSANEQEKSASRAEGDPLPEPFTYSTGYLLSTAGRLIRDEFQQALESTGLKARHYGVLATLALEGPLPQGTVARKLMVYKSAMVLLIDELEETGLVERRRNPRNRRAYELSLTEAGRKKLADAQSVIEGVEEPVLASLDEQQNAQLRDTLLRLISTLHERRDV